MGSSAEKDGQHQDPKAGRNEPLAEVATHQYTADLWPSLMDKLALQSKDWVGLSSGDQVYVRRSGQVLIRGTVEDIASDGSIFWVWIHDGGGRIALRRDDEVSLWLAEEPKSIRSCPSCTPTSAWGIGGHE